MVPPDQRATPSFESLTALMAVPSVKHRYKVRIVEQSPQLYWSMFRLVLIFELTPVSSMAFLSLTQSKSHHTLCG